MRLWTQFSDWSNPGASEAWMNLAAAPGNFVLGKPCCSLLPKLFIQRQTRLSNRPPWDRSKKTQQVERFAEPGKPAANRALNGDAEGDGTVEQTIHH